MTRWTALQRAFLCLALGSVALAPLPLLAHFAQDKDEDPIEASKAGEPAPPKAQSPSSPTTVPRLSALREKDEAGIIRHKHKSGHYWIEARLDESHHRLHATLKLRYRNPSAQAITRIPFYTYLNAMSHSDTPWMRASGAAHRGHRADFKHLAYLDIQSIQIASADPKPSASPQAGSTSLDLAPAGPGSELPATLSADRSLLWVKLPAPLNPDQSIDLHIHFISQLPRVFSRTGFSKDFILASMWYPKPAVRSDEGWHATPFSFHGEFFSDFADYEIWLDLPADYQATGSGFEDASHDRPAPGPGRHWHHRRAEMVVDFAWSAATQWRCFSAVVDDVEIEARVAPEYAHEGPEHLMIQVEALSAIQKRYGPYPWRNINFVLPPADAAGSFGMEYATFYTTSPYSKFSWPRFLVDRPFYRALTTLHEFSHQYFPGLVASDESRDPWLDEGLATTSEILLYYDIFGPERYATLLLGHPARAEALIRIGLTHDTIDDQVQKAAAGFLAYPNTYGTSVYTKAALALLTLRNICGPELFDRVMRDYVETFRFLHPSAQDFRDHLNRGLAGQCLTHAEFQSADEKPPQALDVRRYLEQVLDRPFSLDFRARIYAPRPYHPRQGYHFDLDTQNRGHQHQAPQWRAAKPHSPKQIEQFVVLQREGAVEVPVVVEFTWQNGQSERRVWSSSTPFHTLRFVSDNPNNFIRRVEIDPEDQINLEKFRSNNIVLAPGVSANDDESWFRRIGYSIVRAIQVALWGMFS